MKDINFKNYPVTLTNSTKDIEDLKLVPTKFESTVYISQLGCNDVKIANDVDVWKTILKICQA